MKRPRLRSTTGCVNCRRRYRKCDEVKPVCTPCSRIGLTCTWPMLDGLAGGNTSLNSATTSRGGAQDRNQTQHDTSLIAYSYDVGPPANTSQAICHTADDRSAQASRRSASPSILQELVNPTRLSVSEQIFIEYFFRKTLSMFCSYGDSELWDTSIPYAITFDDTMRCCAAALGAWHAKMNGRNSTSPYSEAKDLILRSFALYNKALFSFRTDLSLSKHGQPFSVALPCLMFILLESAFGRKTEMIMHLSTGLRLLDGQPSISEHDSKIYVTLSRIKLFTELCSRRFDDTPVELHRLSRVRDHFHGIEQLKFDTHMLTLSVHQLMHQRRLHQISDAEYFDARLKLSARLIKLQECIRTHPENSDRDAKNPIFDSLLAECELLNAYIEVDPMNKQEHFDAYTEAYERVLQYLANCLICIRRLQAEFPPPLSLDCGVTAALFLTATICRRPHVRREILNLLHACPRREGLWDSEEAIVALQHLMRHEEAGLGLREGEEASFQTIPEQTRAKFVFIAKAEPINDNTSSLEVYDEIGIEEMKPHRSYPIRRSPAPF